jgi:phosphatidylglycerol---prolipoprotein diacylglyceryl transferase
LPVHPAQLYSSIDAFLITLLLVAWTPFRRHDGEVAALMITIYPIVRIFEEAIRTDEPKRFITNITISQNISILILAVAVAVWIYVLRQPRLKYAPAAP